MSILRNKMKRLLARFKAPRFIMGLRDSKGVFQPNVKWSDTVDFYLPENIHIADHVSLGHYVLLDGMRPLTIGEGTQLGARVCVFTHSSHMSIRMYGSHQKKLKKQGQGAYVLASVTIGKYVFVGTGSIITAGVTIGDGCIIGAGCLIQKNIPSHSIVKGNPAEIIGTIDQIDRRYLAEHPEFKEYYYDRGLVTD